MFKNTGELGFFSIKDIFYSLMMLSELISKFQITLRVLKQVFAFMKTSYIRILLRAFKRIIEIFRLNEKKMTTFSLTP